MLWCVGNKFGGLVLLLKRTSLVSDDSLINTYLMNIDLNSGSSITKQRGLFEFDNDLKLEGFTQMDSGLINSLFWLRVV